MKPIRILVFLLASLTLLGGTAFTQGLSEKEPARGQLGAPIYPGAVYIRTVTGLDPFLQTAEYVTRDNIETVQAFFERKLSEKRQIFYESKDLYLVAFLMKTWSKIPGNPKKEELAMLEQEPNVQIRTYDSTLYGTLIDYFQGKAKAKSDALSNGNTMIRYTFIVKEEETSAKNIVGLWKNSDRDLPGYLGCTIEFRGNNTYSLTLTEENQKALKSGSGGKTETGTYAILNNTISLEAKAPVRGEGKKSGLANVGRASLSLELIGMPRLTFIRVRK